MPNRLYHPDGRSTYVSTEAELDAAIAEGFSPEGGSVTLTDDRGRNIEVGGKDIERARSQGAGLESAQSRIDRGRAQNREALHGGTVDRIQTFGEEALSTATFGLSDLGLSDTQRHERRERQAENSTSSLIGSGVGALVNPITRFTGGGKNLIAKATAEGGALGFGTGVSELALSEDPVTLERAASVLSSSTLYGGAIGGGASIFAKAAGKGIARARKAMDDVGSKADDVTGDLANLDRAGLRKAKDLELDRLEEIRTGHRTGLSGEVKDYNASLSEVLDGEEGLWARLRNSPEGSKQRELYERFGRQTEGEFKYLEAERARGMSELPEQLREYKAAIADMADGDNGLWSILRDAPSGTQRRQLYARLAKTHSSRGSLNKLLEKNARALERRPALARNAIDESDQLLADLAEEIPELEPKLQALLQHNAKLRGRIDELVTPLRPKARSGLDRLLEKNGRAIERRPGMAREALEESEQMVADLAREVPELQPKLRELMRRNANLRSQVDELAIPRSQLASPRLEAIATAGDNLVTGGKKGFVEKIAEGSGFGVGTALAAPLGPLAPFVGAKFAEIAGDVVTGRLSRFAAKGQQRGAKAISRFLDTAAPAAKKAQVNIAKVLSSVNYGPSPKRKSKVKGSAKTQSFRARAKEIRLQTVRQPDGSFKMTVPARQAVSERIAPLRHLDPMAADGVETIAARRMAFLAEKLPLKPGIGIETGPDRWRPSEFEISKFARYMAAVEDPDSVLERLADTRLTPEDAEALREVYPEIYADAQRQLMEKLPELRETLPYKKRLMLSLFFDTPVDPAMDPSVLAVLQGQFAQEPGADGGYAAPTAQPQFGSVKSPDATPAQERAG